MLNEEKIRVMHEIAVYTGKEEKKELPAGQYFRSDYVARHMLQSFFAWSAGFVLFAAVAFLYSLNRILNSVNIMDLVVYLKKAAVFYAAGLLIYEIITLIVYRRKYAASVRKREEHLNRLNRLKKRYDVQERLRELAREGGRNA